VACTVDACDEDADACTHGPDDALCDDGAWCNGAETCDPQDGCLAGTPPDCDDGVSCTIDACDEAADACTHGPDDALCDDGAWCNGAETCDPTGGCQAGQAPVCDDGVGCTDDACNEDTDSCDFAVNDGNCDNGLYCDGDEFCDPQLDCQDGPDPDCDDGVSCTVDACNEDTDSCDNTPDDGFCNDGQYCNGEETCDPLDDCQAGTPPVCDDGVGCTDDACNEDTDSCDFIPDDGNCDDGIACTEDVCDVLDDCQALPSDENCDDGVYCTVDTCDPSSLDADLDGCVISPDDGLCDDDPLRDRSICTLEACLPDDEDAAPSGCLFTLDPDASGDPICELEICRTPGFWGTHPGIVEQLLGSGITVCGIPVLDILVDSPNSAIEGLCTRPRGSMEIKAVRNLITTALNCIMINGDATCAGTTVGELFADLDSVCASGSRGGLNELSRKLDCWNNGGDLSLWDTYGCVTGFCDGIPDPDYFCSGDKNCGGDRGSCVPFPDSCHEQPLVNLALGWNFEPSGIWADPRPCRGARQQPKDSDCTPFTPEYCGD
jgi:hypothetical protein